MNPTVHPLVQQALQAYGIEHTVLDCDPTLADTAAFCEAYGYSADQSANTIILTSKAVPAEYAACLVLANTRLDVNGVARREMNVKKASFAPMEQALLLSGMEYGGVTIVGLPNTLPILVDQAVLQQPQIILGGGNRSSKLLISPDQLHKIPGLRVVPNLAKPAPLS